MNSITVPTAILSPDKATRSTQDVDVFWHREGCPLAITECTHKEGHFTITHVASGLKMPRVIHTNPAALEFLLLALANLEWPDSQHEIENNESLIESAKQLILKWADHFQRGSR